MIRVAAPFPPLLLLATPILLASCRRQSPPPPTTEAPPPGIPAVARGNDEFAIDLYQKLRDRRGNLVVAPAGLSAALAAAWAGARGRTADEIARVLHADLEPGVYHRAFGALVRGWNTKSRSSFRMAGGFWLQRGPGLRDGFREILRSDYGLAAEEVDFRGDPGAARGLINAWAAKQAPAGAPELLRPGTIDETTRLVLANACAFKGAWDHPFEPGATFPEPFVLAGGEKVEAPMMHRTGEFGFKAGTTFQALELRYADDPRRLLILVPRETDGLDALEWGLTSGAIKDLAEGFQTTEVNVTLPRFAVASSHDLGPALAELGMPTAFGRSADFSGMAGRPGDLFISAVVQEARIDVDEKGTVASAETAILVKGAESPEGPKVFRADHPFLFLIRDGREGGILFLGRFADPRGQG